MTHLLMHDAKTCTQQAEKTEEVAEKPEKAAEGEKPESKEPEEDKKVTAQKKSKISVDIGAELQVNDVLDPAVEAIESSKKK